MKHKTQKGLNVIEELMTDYGYVKTTNELKDLKENQLPAIVKEVDIARSHGDLKENAEYHAAKEKQAFITSKISELSDLVSRAEVIDPTSLNHLVVSFGSTVKVMDLDTDKKITYTLVGSNESDADNNLISYNSPIAKSFLGKKVGDEAEFTIGNNERFFEILEVSFKEINFVN